MIATRTPPAHWAELPPSPKPPSSPPPPPRRPRQTHRQIVILRTTGEGNREPATFRIARDNSPARRSSCRPKSPLFPPQDHQSTSLVRKLLHCRIISSLPSQFYVHHRANSFMRLRIGLRVAASRTARVPPSSSHLTSSRLASPRLSSPLLGSPHLSSPHNRVSSYRGVAVAAPRRFP